MRSIESINLEIDNEIIKLINIKYDVHDTMSALNGLKNAIPISKTAYDRLLINNELKNDVLYYIVKPEVGKYIDGYIA